ncbi:sodium/hydrogen exchanger [Flammeovirgaceae bacterium 311]|nr:sodium/hydrogen exchanger [Flammeovirgaceae bacterium 311]
MSLTLVLFIVSLLWLILGSIINKLQQIFLTEPIVALITGVMVGPVFSLITLAPEQQHQVLEWGAKLTITMSLMAAALKMKHSYLMTHKQMLSVLVLGSMLLMFVFSTLLVKFILGIEWPMAILIGAVVTPTDPVVSSSMISGKYADKYLNNNIKSSIIFESGVNDGLAFPLVAIGWMLFEPAGIDWSQWAVKDVGYQNIMAAAAGALIGYLAGLVMHKAHKANFMSQKTLLSYSVGLGILVLSLLELLHMNGIIGVFFAGLLFNRKIKKIEDLEEERVQEAMERLFTIPVFFLLGMFIPWQDWLVMDWPLLLLIPGILLFRRIPALILLKPALKQISRWPRVLLIGWFGPIGVAALFYAIHSLKKTGYEDVYIITTAVITASVMIHGLSSIPISRLYHRHDVNNVEGDSEEENNEDSSQEEQNETEGKAQMAG